MRISRPALFNGLLDLLLSTPVTRRRRLNIVLALIAIAFVSVVLVDALDLLSDQTWSEVPHGNHSHFVPNDRDDGVSISDCPQRPPSSQEILSSQCQLIQVVSDGSETRYVPVDRNPNVPVERFPTRPPGPGVVITPTGELAQADKK